jgi:hypothetical protein
MLGQLPHVFKADLFCMLLAIPSVMFVAPEIGSDSSVVSGIRCLQVQILPGSIIFLWAIFPQCGFDHGLRRNETTSGSQQRLVYVESEPIPGAAQWTLLKESLGVYNSSAFSLLGRLLKKSGWNYNVFTDSRALDNFSTRGVSLPVCYGKVYLTPLHWLWWPAQTFLNKF